MNGITIKHKRKAGPFSAGQLAAGEMGVDVTNRRIYFSVDGTTVDTLSEGENAVLLSMLEDVSVASIANGHVLVYDDATGQWRNQSLSNAGISAVGHNHTVSDISDFQSSVSNNTNVSANTAARHTHSNKTVLDALTDAGSGQVITSTERSLIASAIQAAEKGSANGVATLDASGHVPLSQLPDSVIGAVEYKGTWNANTNTPSLTTGTHTKGDYYVVNVSGSTTLGGTTDWNVGDWAIYNGTAWEKVDNTDQVTSVFGRQGTITAEEGDYNATQVSFTSPFVTGETVQSAIELMHFAKANAEHNHHAEHIVTGDLSEFRMTMNVAKALNLSPSATINNSGLIIDGGTL